MESADDLGASLNEQALAVAQAFVQARRDARVLESYPGERPSDLSLAYRIQDRAIVLDGRRVVGWKVGKINPPDDLRLGCNRLAGPIFADTVMPAEPGVIPEMPIFAGSFAAAEAELLLHLAPGWDGALPHDDAATRSLLDDIRLGIEIASSPYPGINADGPTVTASDFGNNAGLVIGPPLRRPNSASQGRCGVLDARMTQTNRVFSARLDQATARTSPIRVLTRAACVPARDFSR